jgi:hypothetical protein
VKPFGRSYKVSNENDIESNFGRTLVIYDIQNQNRLIETAEIIN